MINLITVSDKRKSDKMDESVYVIENEEVPAVQDQRPSMPRTMVDEEGDTIMLDQNDPVFDEPMPEIFVSEDNADLPGIEDFNTDELPTSKRFDSNTVCNQRLSVSGLAENLMAPNGTGKCFQSSLKKILNALPNISDAKDLFESVGEGSNSSEKIMSAMISKLRQENESSLISPRAKIEILNKIVNDRGVPMDAIPIDADDSIGVQFEKTIQNIAMDFSTQGPNKYLFAHRVQDIVQEQILSLITAKFNEIVVLGNAVTSANYKDFFINYSVIMNLLFNVDKNAKEQLTAALTPSGLCDTKRSIVSQPHTIPQLFLPRFFTPTFPKSKMLLWMGPGTGKTCTAISALNEYIDNDWTILWVLPPKNSGKMKQQLKNDMFRLGCLETFVEDMKNVHDSNVDGADAEAAFTPPDMFFKRSAEARTDEDVDIALQVMKELYTDAFDENGQIREDLELDENGQVKLVVKWDELSNDFFKYYGQSWVNSEILQNIYGEGSLPGSRRRGGLPRKAVCRPGVGESDECVDFGNVVMLTCPQFAHLMLRGESSGKTLAEKIQSSIWRRLKDMHFKKTIIVLDEAHNWFHAGSMDGALSAQGSRITSDDIRQRVVLAMNKMSTDSRATYSGSDLFDWPCKFLMLSATPIADTTMIGFSDMLSFMQETEPGVANPVRITPRTMLLLRKRVLNHRSFTHDQKYREEQELVRLAMLQVCYVSADSTQWFGTSPDGKSAMPNKELVKIIDVELPRVQKEAALQCMVSKAGGSTKSTCLQNVATGANQIMDLDPQNEKRFSFLNPYIDHPNFDTEKLFTHWLEAYGAKFNEVVRNIERLQAEHPEKKHLVYIDGDMNQLFLAGALRVKDVPYIPLKAAKFADANEVSFRQDLLQYDNSQKYFGLAGVQLKTLKKYKSDRVWLPWVTASGKSAKDAKEFTPSLWNRYQSDMISMFNEPNMTSFNVLVINDQMREGISLFGVGYVHMVSVPASDADFIQTVGRATRLCGNKDIGYSDVEVLVYRSKLDSVPGSNNPYTVNDEVQLQSRQEGSTTETAWKSNLEEGFREATALNVMGYYVKLVKDDDQLLPSPKSKQTFVSKVDAMLY